MEQKPLKPPIPISAGFAQASPTLPVDRDCLLDHSGDRWLPVGQCPPVLPQDRHVQVVLLLDRRRRQLHLELDVARRRSASR